MWSSDLIDDVPYEMSPELAQEMKAVYDLKAAGKR